MSRLLLCSVPVRARIGILVLLCGCVGFVASARAQGLSSDAISREVKQIFDRCAKAVVKIHGVDEHSELSGTGFFVDPTGVIYTAYSVAGEGANFTVEYNGKKLPARRLLADLRSGVAMLTTESASPALPLGKAARLGVATPIVMIGYPLDLPATPSFGLVAGFDRKYLDRYLTTTHLRANVPTQRGEAGAPLLNTDGEVVGIVVSSLENSSACYALPIEAAEKIRGDFVRFGEVRHGWIGVHLAEAEEEKAGSRAEMTDVLPNTPAADSGLQAGDILLQVGQKPIHQPDDIIDASFFITAGERIPIVVMRGQERLTFEVQSDFHPSSQHLPMLGHLPVIAQPSLNQTMPMKLQRTPE
ncbi:MAG: S1C family serine protease [Verrucomicrobiota bacterium]